ncbi:MAG: HmuY family protein [Longimicrobiales bacterium]
MSDLGEGRRLKSNIPFVAITLVVVGVAATFVAASLRRPELDMFQPTPAAPHETGSAMIGPVVHTADATKEGWSYFDFSRGSAVDDPEGANWDLAFRRHSIIVNGGPGFTGQGGVLETTVPFDSLTTAPAEGYVSNRVRGDTVNTATEDWYDYSWMSHVLRPKPATYVVRTADGNYAKLEILSYYCPGAIAGCVTFRYVYQGDGTNGLSALGRAEARSLLGELLFPPTYPPEVAADRRAILGAALADLEASPTDADAIIWAGRRHAYLAHYRTAIELFGEGAELHPGDARFLRHRGHRHISIRDFDQAIVDLEEAVRMIDGQTDEVEPDGLPNALGIPTGTLHSNICYHLGLAHYLNGDFELARAALRECMAKAWNDDTRVATAYWTYLTLRRLSLGDEALELLAEIDSGMEIIENTSYLDLLLLFKGDVSATDLLGPGGESTLEAATLGYGIAMSYAFDGDAKRAGRILEQVLSARDQWAAFGYVAAEAEVARLGGL